MSTLTASWLGLALGLALGVAVALSPVWTAAWAGGLALLLALVIATWSSALWRWCCLALLIGYLVLGRGFAYISLPLQLALPDTYSHIPIYIGELILLVCLITMPHQTAWPAFSSIPAARWLFPWLILGLALTIPSAPFYGLNALRDAATWYYAIFLYVGFAFVSRQPELSRLFRILGIALLLHLVYSLAYLLHLVDFEALPIHAPGSNFPLFVYRYDVSAVVFLGGAIFALLLARHYWRRALTRWLFALPQFALFIAMEKRAAYVGFVLASAVLLYLRRLGPMLRIALMAVFILILAASWGRELELVGVKASPGRVAEFVLTMFDVGGRGQYRYGESESSIGTFEWRREYWELVIADSLQDPLRFVVGRGFGPDLVTSTKYTFGGDRPNRNPHNIAVTVFGRMGLFGLLLWAAFHVSVFRQLLVGIGRADRCRDAWSRDVLTFVLVYTVAVLGASLFSVMLESPFVGIPYYFLLGCGLRVAVSQPAREMVGSG